MELSLGSNAARFSIATTSNGLSESAMILEIDRYINIDQDERSEPYITSK